MATPLSLTAAIRESARCVSIFRFGGAWKVRGPWDINRPNGPSTEWQFDTYVKARLAATAWRAEVVLSFMDRLNYESRGAIHELEYEHWGPHTLRAFVDAGLKASRVN